MHDLAQLVAVGGRVLGDSDQGDLVWGHVSARDPQGRGVWMKAAGWGFEEVDPKRVLLVSPEGEVVAGEGHRHVEYHIHTEILRARPDVASVVHVHSPHAIALAATGHPLRPISHEGTLFTPPTVPRFTKTADLIQTRELGALVAETLGDHRAIFLVNHGVVTVGPDVATAVVTAVLLDRACKTQLMAMAAGGWSTWSSDEEALAKREHCYSPTQLASAWEYLVRRLPDQSHAPKR
jgi:ribulose-5-phosphate 4-epimerase/fuculose-1-phosphate aldolase